MKHSPQTRNRPRDGVPAPQGAKRPAWWHCERGGSLVEMGLALPLLTLLLLGVIDLGRAAYFSIEVQNAAEAAAIYGTHNPADTTGMEAVAVADAANVPGGITVATPVTGCMCSDGKTGKSPGCTVQPTRCPTSTSAVNYVTITTSYNYTPMFAWPGIPSSITLTGSSTMRY